MFSYPDSITISPRLSVQARVKVPGSKSLTNRALILAALANGTTTMTGALDSDDTRVMLTALSTLGFDVKHDAESATIVIVGRSGKIPAKGAQLFLGNSGTSLRFLTAMTAIGYGDFTLDGVPRMRERPIADLIQALNGLGSTVKSELGTGCPPVLVHASGLDGGIAIVKGDVSSQFLSALLMVSPYCREATSIIVDGELVSTPYVSMTLDLMEIFGVQISNRKFRRFDIVPQRYHSRPFAIEPDASSASYFFAGAALAGGSITVDGLGSTSKQGDLRFVDLLEVMGCKVERGKTETTVSSGDFLRGIDADMNNISDTVMTLAVLAVFAQGHTRIRNVGHIRHKETDRLAALATELRKLGATVDELADGLVIFPPAKVTPASIETYDDHRMAMAFALAGLRTEGINIQNPGCVAKTYPGFWEAFQVFPAK